MWEYEIVDVSSLERRDVVGKLKTMGEQRWELCGVASDGWELYFKRRKQIPPLLENAEDVALMARLLKKHGLKDEDYG